MKEETKMLKHKFNEYYECPNGCGAIYHKVCIDRAPFECRDCKTLSHVPPEIKIKERNKFKPEFNSNHRK